MEDRGINNFLRREYPLLILGLLGMVVYFWLYPRQAPVSSITIPVGQSEIITTAQNFLRDEGIDVSNLRPEATLQRLPELLDSLNSKYGREGTTRLLKETDKPVLPAFYWHVAFYPLGNLEKKLDSTQTQQSTGIRVNSIYNVDVTQNGHVWQFQEPTNRRFLLPHVNRTALAATLSDNSNHSAGDSLATFLSNVSDSILERQIIFVLGLPPPGQNARSISNTDIMNRLNGNRRPLILNHSEAIKLALYHLNRSEWKYFDFKTDSVYMVAGSDRKVARVSFVSNTTILKQPLHVYLDVSASGGLVGMTGINKPGERSGPGGNTQVNLSELITVLLYVLLFIFFLFIFIRRLDARLIDTRTAITDGVMGWFLAILPSLLGTVYEIQNLAAGTSIMYYIIYMLQPLVVAFAGGFAMFLGSGTTESIARDALPEKTETLALLRRGYLHNHRFGAVCARSVFIATLFMGIYTLVLFLFPHISLFNSSSPVLFLSDKAFISPVYAIGNNGYYALTVCFFLLLGIGSYLYEYRKQAWLMIIGTGLLFAPLALNSVSGSIPATWIVNGIIGLGLGYIYYKYDFLTSVITFFFFLLLIQTAQGWMIPHSPDLGSSLVTWVLMLSTGFVGYWGLTSAQTGDEIPEYVPMYVEEFSQRQRMERELEIARSVQVSFLPRETPKLEHFEISAICHSAFEVGGDYYDFIDLGNGKTAVAIGDVSGKGIQAAFYMTLVKGFIQSLCHQIESPAELLEYTNTLFCRNAERGTFISMIYGILDANNQTFTFARAGHNPLLYREASNKKADFLRPSGMALGLTDQDVFSKNITDVTLKTAPGSLIVMFTDGFTEAMNARKELFGDDRLIETITKYSDLVADEMITKITGDVKRFVNGQEQHDDMTMIVIKAN